MFLINPYRYVSATPSFTDDYSTLFDGVDELVYTPTISMLSGASSASVSLWVKDLASGTTQSIFGVQTSGTIGFKLVLISTGHLWAFNRASGYTTGIVKGSTTPTLTGWHHVAMVFDGSLTGVDRLKIYWDGSVLATALSGSSPAPATFTNTSNFQVGANGQGGTPVNGNIDDFSIFDYALTSGEVTAISGMPTDLMTLAEAKRPEHYYRMGDGDTFPTITDHGNTGGNDLTMLNMESGDFVLDTP